MLNGIKFFYEHVDSGEFRFVELSLDQIQDALISRLRDVVMHCDCRMQPRGETDVVECNCEEYLDGFDIIPRRHVGTSVLQSAKEIEYRFDE